MSDVLELARRATLRVLRNKESPTADGPYAVSFGHRGVVAVMDPERFAACEPQRFANYLCSTYADPGHWEFRKLLTKKSQDSLPEVCPAVAVAAAIKERGYWYHGSPDGLLTEKGREDATKTNNQNA